MKAVQHLVPQLSSSAGPPSRREVEEIVSSPGTTLLVARDDTLDETDGVAGQDAAANSDEPRGPIVGMLTLVTFRIPTGVRTRIEDVVVDSAGRGQASLQNLPGPPSRSQQPGVPTLLPDVATVSRGSQPPIPTPRLRPEGDGRLPLRTAFLAAGAGLLVGRLSKRAPPPHRARPGRHQAPGEIRPGVAAGGP